MYANLPLRSLVPHPNSANRMSRALFKKLRNSIKTLGRYETLTVRVHPTARDNYEVLNGHMRLQALRDLGQASAKCDVWDVSDSDARLYLALLNKLSGSDVPELRLDLILQLIHERNEEEICGLIPENRGQLSRLKSLEENGPPPGSQQAKLPLGTVIADFYLTPQQHKTVTQAVAHICERFHLPDSASGLARLAQLYLDSLAHKASERSDCETVES